MKLIWLGLVPAALFISLYSVAGVQPQHSCEAIFGKPSQAKIWHLFQDGRQVEASQLERQILEVMEHGQFISNVPILDETGEQKGVSGARLLDFGDFQAVWKPTGALGKAQREKGAYLVDRKLPLNMVPATGIRTINGIEGSIQLYVPSATIDEAHLFFGVARLSLFDFLISNGDRKNSLDVLYEAARFVAIDNGLGFGSNATSINPLDHNLNILGKEELIVDRLKKRLDQGSLTESEATAYAGQIACYSTENLQKIRERRLALFRASIPTKDFYANLSRISEAEWMDLLRQAGLNIYDQQEFLKSRQNILNSFARGLKVFGEKCLEPLDDFSTFAAAASRPFSYSEPPIEYLIENRNDRQFVDYWLRF